MNIKYGARGPAEIRVEIRGPQGAGKSLVRRLLEDATRYELCPRFDIIEVQTTAAAPPKGGRMARNAKGRNDSTNRNVDASIDRDLALKEEIGRVCRYLAAASPRAWRKFRLANPLRRRFQARRKKSD